MTKQDAGDWILGLCLVISVVVVVGTTFFAPKKNHVPWTQRCTQAGGEPVFMGRGYMCLKPDAIVKVPE
jgi:hypothetical protein